MIIKMLQTHICWPEINKPIEFLDGEEYILPDDLAVAFINQGYARGIENGKINK